MKVFLEKIIAVFFILGFLFIPLTMDGRDWQFELTNFLFSKPIALFQNQLFPKAFKIIDFSSDTIALNCLLILLFLIAVLLVFIFKLFKVITKEFVTFSRITACYYVAFVLLKYGFDKVFKTQFYLPEPNILFTPFGNLSKDILYWSTLGTSYSYSVSMGIIEVVTAILLFFKRTRILGLLIAIGVFVNIVLINFGFDISVKTFSIFLLLASVFAVFPYLKTLFTFLVLQQKEQIEIEKSSIIKNPILKIWLKLMIIGLMLLQILFPYFQSGNFNDDTAKRNFLHGAYQVTEIIKGNDTLKPKDFSIENIFIHRNNYIIFKGKNSKMTDYHFEINPSQSQLILEKYNNKKIFADFQYVKKDSILTLNFNDFKIISKAINWRKLPAIKDSSHFTIDEIQ